MKAAKYLVKINKGFRSFADTTEMAIEASLGREGNVVIDKIAGSSAATVFKLKFVDGSEAYVVVYDVDGEEYNVLPLSEERLLDVVNTAIREAEEAVVKLGAIVL